MRFLLAVLFGMPLAAAVILSAFGGDPFATSIAAGFVALFVLQHIAARSATRPAPRKADPAKIARLERELGIAEAPTTRIRPPTERSVDDCPRPEGCVIAHPCRKCGADRGEPCVGDVYLAPTMYLPPSATFHGAPTFGRKIEGP